MSREKTRSHARHAARSTALVQTWIDQSETLLLFFAETNQRQSCSRVPQSSWSLSSTCTLSPEELWVEIYYMCKGLWDGAYGLSSLSGKTRKSTRLQMLLQRQHFLLSYLKTLVRPGFEPTASCSADRRLSHWANWVAVTPDYNSRYVKFQKFPWGYVPPLACHVLGSPYGPHIVSPLNVLHQGLQTKNAWERPWSAQ